MSTQDGNGGRPPGAPGRADEPGDYPIAELASFAEPVAPGFLGRLRNRIHRRELTGEVVRLGWHAPLLVLMEFVSMIFGLLDGGGDAPNKREE